MDNLEGKQLFSPDAQQFCKQAQTALADLHMRKLTPGQKQSYTVQAVSGSLTSVRTTMPAELDRLLSTHEVRKPPVYVTVDLNKDTGNSTVRTSQIDDNGNVLSNTFTFDVSAHIVHFLKNGNPEIISEKDLQRLSVITRTLSAFVRS